MRFKHLSGWESFWLQAALVWVAGVALSFFWQHRMEAQRLNFWAESIEWIINADPSVPVSAKELRGKLGNEKFIEVAALAYPRVDLREILRRYESDRGTRTRYERPVVAFVLWALTPPASLYVFGMLVSAIASRLRRPKSSG